MMDNERQYLYRDVDEKFLKWKNECPDKVLVVQGQAFVGKTFSLRRFVTENFKCVVYVELLWRHRDFRTMCIDTFRTKRHDDLKSWNSLFRLCNKSFVDSEDTVICLDDVHMSPELLRDVLNIRSKFKSRIILSGVTYKMNYLREHLESLRADNIVNIDVYTLTFDEFLRAVNFYDTYREMVDHDVHDVKSEIKIKELYDRYCVIGGFPRYVSDFSIYLEESSKKKLSKKQISNSKREFENQIFGTLQDTVDSVFKSIALHHYECAMLDWAQLCGFVAEILYMILVFRYAPDQAKEFKKSLKDLGFGYKLREEYGYELIHILVELGFLSIPKEYNYDAYASDYKDIYCFDVSIANIFYKDNHAHLPIEKAVSDTFLYLYLRNKGYLSDKWFVGDLIGREEDILNFCEERRILQFNIKCDDGFVKIRRKGSDIILEKKYLNGDFVEDVFPLYLIGRVDKYVKMVN
jgi:hypothetical protein